VLVILIVLYISSQLASTLLMSTTTDRTQRMLFLALPFFFVLFVWQFPAGLLVYWITTNTWTIAQQAIVRRRLGPLRPPGQEQESLGDMLKKLRGGDEAAPKQRGGGGDGAKARPERRVKEKAAVSNNEPKGKPSGPPPAPPKRKKKRSGRRR
jgi:YidC/Oxa1 family membrane protein insertase